MYLPKAALKKREKNVDREDTRRVKINEEWAKETVKVISMEGDLHFHATKGENCPSAEKIIKELKKSHEFEQMEKYFGLTLYTQLASAVNEPLGFKLLDPETLNIKQVKSVLDNYRCNFFHGNEHPNVVDEAILNRFKLSSHEHQYFNVTWPKVFFYDKKSPIVYHVNPDWEDNLPLDEIVDDNEAPEIEL